MIKVIVGEDNIVEEAIKFFKQQFSKEDTVKDSKIMECIPKLITEEDNINLIAPTSLDELKDIVFSMSTQSAPGPNGISGKFYHSCWNKHDLLMIVLDFFVGTPLPRSLSHSCLVMIPKVETPQQFTDRRPISLSNFSSKIISKLLNQRLYPLMNKIISP